MDKAEKQINTIETQAQLLVDVLSELVKLQGANRG